MTNPLLKKWFLPAGALLVLLLLIAWMLGLIGGGKTGPGLTPLPARSTPPRATARVEKRQVRDTQSWPGTVRALSEARVAPKINARILAVAVREGDRVKQGAVLARLDAEQNRAIEHEAASLAAAARAEAVRAQADLKRTQELFAQEAATREAYEHAEAAAQKALAGARAATYGTSQAAIERRESVLRAPFDGVIAQRLHEPGDMGLAGEPIVILHNAAALRLEASVPASCSGEIHIGDTVAVRIDALKISLDARVDEIVPAADPLTGTVLVKAGLPATPLLQPGLFGWLERSCGRGHTVLLIPSPALRRIGQVEIVTVVQDGGGLGTRHVRSGSSYDGLIEILSGLDEGETVVIR
jgi:membrane fusion protein (multidrug efflux system)